MLAFLFPGQGAQRVGMMRALCDRYPTARQVFDSADQALGFSLSRLCFEGPEETLQLTANAQPAILTASVAALRVLQEESALYAGDGTHRGLLPDVVAGHSLGEYTALVCAGALDFQDAVRLVRVRGQLMQEAVAPGIGAMAALIGSPPDAVEALCAEAAQGQVLSAANYNAPAQTVIAGHAEAVNRAVQLAGQRGVTAKLLKVSAPFHCSLMQPAADRLQGEIERVSIQPLAIPVIRNVDAQPYTSPEQVATYLVRQAASPVRWHACIQRMLAMGVTELLEIGPGKALSSLLRQVEGVSVRSLEEPIDVDIILKKVEFDWKPYCDGYRDERWSIRESDGARVNADETRILWPDGLEWDFNDPANHGL